LKRRRPGSPVSVTTRITQSSNVAPLAALSHARLAQYFILRSQSALRTRARRLSKKFQHIVVSKNMKQK
jgi:hypothetical protein